MANLTRFDPFADITRFDPFGTMDEWMRDWSLRPALRDMKAEPRIKVDVDEHDTEYIVKAEIPGVNKEDIKVDVDGNLVSISAECKRESGGTQQGKSLRCERYYGIQSRSFTLEHDIDDAAVTATYKDGVLQLQLPKKAGGARKHIAIQ